MRSGSSAKLAGAAVAVRRNGGATRPAMLAPEMPRKSLRLWRAIAVLPCSRLRISEETGGYDGAAPRWQRISLSLWHLGDYLWSRKPALRGAPVRNIAG